MGAWYKEWYVATPQGRADLIKAINDPYDGPDNLADVKKRLEELVQISEERCSISRDQRRFLESVLNDQ